MTMNITKNSHELIGKIIDRLADRKKLLAVSLELACHTNESFFDCYTEQDTGVTCTPANNGFIGQIFWCSSTFDCSKFPPNSFFCNQGTITYTNNCLAGNNNIQCNVSGNTQFECKSGSNPANYFDCYTFSCDKVSSTSAFDCNAVVDYRCVGNEYQCNNGYTCSAGHGFFCNNTHDCDKFNCAGGTTEGCTLLSGPTVAVSCDKKPGVVNSYSWPNTPDEVDTTPGDFKCAMAGGTSDSFDCQNKFDCTATSDFSCVGSADFKCAQQGTGSNFKCKSTTDFECYDNFECASATLFNCDRPAGASYNCKSSYAVCQSNSKKECKKDYDCKKGHNCEWNNNDFKCLISIYGGTVIGG